MLHYFLPSVSPAPISPTGVGLMGGSVSVISQGYDISLVGGSGSAGRMMVLSGILYRADFLWSSVSLLPHFYQLGCAVWAVVYLFLVAKSIPDG